MKVLFTTVCLFLFIQNSFSQIVELDNKSFLDCDTAYTTLEYTLCASQKLSDAQVQLDSMYNVVLSKLDSLALEMDEYSEEFVDEEVPNYREVKKQVIESQRIFESYISSEREIAGEIFGTGQQRTLVEINRELQLVELRFIELKNILF